MQNSSLNTTFNEDSEKCHKYRPHYPQALFDKLVRDTSLTQAQHVQFVEIVLSADKEETLERVFARDSQGPGAPNSIRDDIDGAYQQVAKAIADRLLLERWRQ